MMPTRRRIPTGSAGLILPWSDHQGRQQQGDREVHNIGRAEGIARLDIGSGNRDVGNHAMTTNCSPMTAPATSRR